MTDAGGADLAGGATNVAALIEAIDARARQSGSEGAATLLRGTLSSVSEVLTNIEGRIDRIEDLLSQRDGADSVVEQVQAALTTFNSRLGRLEEAFVQAVEDSGSGTDAVVDQVRQAVASAIASIPAQADPPDPRPLLDAAVAPLFDRLQTIDERLADALQAPPPPPPAIDPVTREAILGATSGIARVESSLDRLAAIDNAPDLGPVLSAVEDLTGRLESLETRMEHAASALPQPIDPASVDTILQATSGIGRLQSSVDRLAADRPPDPAPVITQALDAMGDRLQAMEERLTSALRPAPAADPAEALAPVLERLAGLEKSIAAQSDTASPVGELLAEITPRIDAIDGRLASLGGLGSLRDAIGELTAAGSALQARVDGVADSVDRAAAGAMAPEAAAELARQVTDAVRKESELLTQRVAALAVGVEASRALLEQHVEETENSIGRRAGEVTRRLAADFGIRGRKGGGTGGRRAARELGRGH